MKNITIEKYTAADKTEWDDFVAGANNGTMFHLQSFLEYHTPGKFDFTHYLIRKNGKIVAILPGAYKENDSVYWSPAGASYGSLVTENISFELALNIVDALLEFFKNKGVSEIFLIPPPLVYNNVFNQHIEYAMLYRKFSFEYHYISHVISLAGDYKQNYNNSTKRKFNKIKKNGLKIVQQNNFEEFYPILLENKRKHNAIPTHSLEDLLKLNALLPVRLKLFLVYYGEKIVAGNLLFLANENVSLCFYNMIDYEYEHLFPAYALVEFVIDWSKENGFKWFDFGVSQDTSAEDPMSPSLPLIYFKEKFGSRGIFRSTFCYKF